jgi:hypothetical protein
MLPSVATGLAITIHAHTLNSNDRTKIMPPEVDHQERAAAALTTVEMAVLQCVAPTIAYAMPLAPAGAH